MMGWAMLAAIGLAAAALLWRIGVARELWAFVGAALMLGAAGYALQGRPALAGSPTRANAEKIEIDPGMVQFREMMFGRFNLEAGYLTLADGMTRNGDTDNAVGAMLAGVRKLPRDVAMWTGLGTALSNHDGGQVSPAAMFAFRRAMQLSPRHPGPPFFLGLAHVQAGKFPAARRAWAVSLMLSPKDAPYRQDIALRLALLDQYLAMAAKQPG